jgi:hypothetical protein
MVAARRLAGSSAAAGAPVGLQHLQPDFRHVVATRAGEPGPDASEPGFLLRRIAATAWADSSAARSALSTAPPAPERARPDAI